MVEEQVLIAGFVEINRIPTRITGNGQKYRVLAGDNILIESSGDPLHDSARLLLADGAADIDDILIMKDGRGRDLMRGRIGSLAHTRIAEGVNHGPRLVEWSPYFGPDKSED